MKPLSRTLTLGAVVALLLALLITGAYLTASGRAPQTEQNKSVVIAYYEDVWNRGNLDALDALLGDAFVDEEACAVEYQERGEGSRAGLKQLIAGIRDSFPDLHAKIDDMLAEGNLVAVRSTFTGTFAPSGKLVTFSGIDIWRVEDGKLQKRWGYFDAAGLLSQVGVLPPPLIGALPIPPKGYAVPTEEDVAVVKRYYDEVWNQGKLVGLDELIGPGFVDHNPDPGQTPDAAGFKQSVIQFGTAFSEFAVVIDELGVDADRVKAGVTFSATFKPTGQRVSFAATEQWRVVDGKLVERWGESDTVDLARDLGMVP